MLRASDTPEQAAGRFFRSLLIVTLIPLCAYVASELVLPGNPAAAQASLWITFLGSSGHVASSFFFYADSRVREHMLHHNRGRFVIAPLSVIAATSLLFQTQSGTPLLPYAVTAYWIWQTHHYSRQNQGILSFVGRAYRAPPSELERTALTVSGFGGVMGALTFVAPYRETWMADYGWHLHQIALGTYAVGWLFYAASLLRSGPGRRGLLRTAIPLVLMLFYLPLFVFENAQVAVGSFAMAHGLQYLIFMSYVAAVPRAAILRRAAALIAFITVLGSALRFLERAEPFGEYRMAVFGAYLGIVMWHFLLDAGVWRLSEPFQRSYMAERFRFL